MKLKHLAGAAIAALAVTAAQAVPTVTFTPSSSQIAIGDSVTIDVAISGLGAEVVSAYDLNMLWNPTIAEFTSLTMFLAEFGTNLSDFGDPDGTANSQGNAGAWLNSVDDDATLTALQGDGEILLFRIDLRGLADGATTLTFGPNLDFQRLFVGLNAEPIDVNIGSACIAVGTGSCDQVPEPAGYGLAAIALLGCGVATTRRRRHPAAKGVA